MAIQMNTNLSIQAVDSNTIICRKHLESITLTAQISLEQSIPTGYTLSATSIGAALMCQIFPSDRGIDLDLPYPISIPVTLSLGGYATGGKIVNVNCVIPTSIFGSFADTETTLIKGEQNYDPGLYLHLTGSGPITLTFKKSSTTMNITGHVVGGYSASAPKTFYNPPSAPIIDIRYIKPTEEPNYTLQNIYSEYYNNGETKTTEFFVYRLAPSEGQETEWRPLDPEKETFLPNTAYQFCGLNYDQGGAHGWITETVPIYQDENTPTVTWNNEIPYYKEYDFNGIKAIYPSGNFDLSAAFSADSGKKDDYLMVYRAKLEDYLDNQVFSEKTSITQNSIVVPGIPVTGGSGDECQAEIGPTNGNIIKSINQSDLQRGYIYQVKMGLESHAGEIVETDYVYFYRPEVKVTGYSNDCGSVINNRVVDLNRIDKDIYNDGMVFYVETEEEEELNDYGSYINSIWFEVFSNNELFFSKKAYSGYGKDPVLIGERLFRSNQRSSVMINIYIKEGQIAPYKDLIYSKTFALPIDIRQIFGQIYFEKQNLKPYTEEKIDLSFSIPNLGYSSPESLKKALCLVEGKVEDEDKLFSLCLQNPTDQRFDIVIGRMAKEDLSFKEESDKIRIEFELSGSEFFKKISELGYDYTSYNTGVFLLRPMICPFYATAPTVASGESVLDFRETYDLDDKTEWYIKNCGENETSNFDFFDKGDKIEVGASYSFYSSKNSTAKLEIGRAQEDDQYVWSVIATSTLTNSQDTTSREKKTEPILFDFEVKEISESKKIKFRVVIEDLFGNRKEGYFPKEYRSIKRLAPTLSVEKLKVNSASGEVDLWLRDINLNTEIIGDDHSNPISEDSYIQLYTHKVGEEPAKNPVGDQIKLKDYFEKISTYSTSIDFGSDWDFVYVTIKAYIKIKLDQGDKEQTYTLFESELYNEIPTVSYRKNLIGINTGILEAISAETREELIAMLGQVGHRHKILFKSTNPDYKTCIVENFSIDGGSWDAEPTALLLEEI